MSEANACNWSLWSLSSSISASSTAVVVVHEPNADTTDDAPRTVMRSFPDKLRQLPTHNTAVRMHAQRPPQGRIPTHSTLASRSGRRKFVSMAWLSVDVVASFKPQPRRLNRRRDLLALSQKPSARAASTPMCDRCCVTPTQQHSNHAPCYVTTLPPLQPKTYVDLRVALLLVGVFAGTPVLTTGQAPQQ